MVSFIIPAHNEGLCIKKTIDSIFESMKAIDKLSFEIIVIDDGSSDNTSDIIAQYPVVKFIRNPEKKGSAIARNIGIKNAKGDIFCFIDADVWLKKNCISELLKYIPHYDIVHTVPFFPDGIPIFPIFATRDYPVITALFMIKKQSLGKLDKQSFDETYEIYNEDLDFFLRCKMFGLTSKYIESAKAEHWIKIPKKPEFRYYMDLRNSIYGYLKFYKLGVNLVGFGTNKVIIQNIIRLLWNKDVYNPIYYNSQFSSASGGLNSQFSILKIWHKLFPRAPITRKTRIYITFLILKAFIWNFLKRKEISREHTFLKSFIIPTNIKPIKFLPLYNGCSDSKNKLTSCISWSLKNSTLKCCE